jgi:hypothetical protein
MSDRPFNSLDQIRLEARLMAMENIFAGSSPISTDDMELLSTISPRPLQKRTDSYGSN